MNTARFAVVTACVVGAALPARAVCQFINPAVFCGAGPTAVVAELVDDQERAPIDGVVVVVTELGGAPMAGLAVGDELQLGPAVDAVTLGIGRAVGTQTAFVLRDLATWTRSAPVVDGRVWIDDDGRHTISSDELLELVDLDDEQTCVDQSNDVVEPKVYRGPCNDTYGPFGCATTPATVPMAAALALLLRRRRRRRR